jgi:phosphoribosylaminoimidazole-succinocarboxamide synthase
MNCITKLETNSPKLKFLHRGKVRDSLRVDDNTRLIVVTDRISAFNKKIKTPIPNKGAVLNGIAAYWFEQTQHIIPNHVIRVIDPNLMLVKEALPIKVEMVVRGYLTGSMWKVNAISAEQKCPMD